MRLPPAPGTKKEPEGEETPGEPKRPRAVGAEQMSSEQRLISHMRTRAKKRLSGSRRKPKGYWLSAADKRLIGQAARAALRQSGGDENDRELAETAANLKPQYPRERRARCVAWMWQHGELKRCTRKPDKSGYCAEHAPEGGKSGDRSSADNGR